MLSLAFLAASIPTTAGISLGVTQGEDKDRAKALGEEVHLTVYCSAPTVKRRQVHQRSIILRNGKLYIDRLPRDDIGKVALDTDKGYPFKGFCVDYPSEARLRGLVSMSCANPPAMGFIYVDSNTMELRYGNRSTSMGHIVGSWDVTDDKDGMTLEGEELFVAVEEEEDTCWALYYDRAGDGQGLPQGKTVLPVSLERRPAKVLERIRLRKS